jgi:hypothetical protein
VRGALAEAPPVYKDVDERLAVERQRDGAAQFGVVER